MLFNDYLRKLLFQEPEEKKKLFCRYETPSPVFILKPVKAEMAFSDPRIIVYHDFMRDREIDYLENLAQKKVNNLYYCSYK